MAAGSSHRQKSGSVARFREVFSDFFVARFWSGLVAHQCNRRSILELASDSRKGLLLVGGNVFKHDADGHERVAEPLDHKVLGFGASALEVADGGRADADSGGEFVHRPT